MRERIPEWNIGEQGVDLVVYINARPLTPDPVIEIKKDESPNYKNRNGGKGRNRFKY